MARAAHNQNSNIISLAGCDGWAGFRSRAQEARPPASVTVFTLEKQNVTQVRVLIGRFVATPCVLVIAAQADFLAVIRQIDRVFACSTLSDADNARRQRAAKLVGGDDAIPANSGQGESFDRRREPTALFIAAENVVELRALRGDGAHGRDGIITDGLATGIGSLWRVFKRQRRAQW